MHGENIAEGLHRRLHDALVKVPMFASADEPPDALATRAKDAAPFARQEAARDNALTEERSQAIESSEEATHQSGGGKSDGSLRLQPASSATTTLHPGNKSQIGVP